MKFYCYDFAKTRFMHEIHCIVLSCSTLSYQGLWTYGQKL